MSEKQVSNKQIAFFVFIVAVIIIILSKINESKINHFPPKIIKIFRAQVKEAAHLGAIATQDQHLLTSLTHIHQAQTILNTLLQFIDKKYLSRLSGIKIQDLQYSLFEKEQEYLYLISKQYKDIDIPDSLYQDSIQP